MAQYTTQGRVKLLLSGEGALFGTESRDSFHYKLRSLQAHKRRTRFFGASSFASSNFNKSANLNADVRVSVSDEGLFAHDDVVNILGVDDEFETDDLACFRGLVLDISYRPVNVVCWKRAICLEFMEKADVLEYYDQTVNSPSGSFYIPAVLRVPHLLQVIKRRRVRNTLSRKNILHRDGYTCQYCSSHENLTIDHVLPQARGGEWKWENLVAACMKCNSRKGQKTLEQANMKLMKTPRIPKDYDILAIPLTNAAIRMLTQRKGTPEEWHQYLSKPSSEH